MLPPGNKQTKSVVHFLETRRTPFGFAFYRNCPKGGSTPSGIGETYLSSPSLSRNSDQTLFIASGSLAKTTAVLAMVLAATTVPFIPRE